MIVSSNEAAASYSLSSRRILDSTPIASHNAGRILARYEIFAALTAIEKLKQSRQQAMHESAELSSKLESQNGMLTSCGGQILSL